MKLIFLISIYLFAQNYNIRSWDDGLKGHGQSAQYKVEDHIIPHDNAKEDQILKKKNITRRNFYQSKRGWTIFISLSILTFIKVSSFYQNCSLTTYVPFFQGISKVVTFQKKVLSRDLQCPKEVSQVY